MTHKISILLIIFLTSTFPAVAEQRIGSTGKGTPSKDIAYTEAAKLIVTQINNRDAAAFQNSIDLNALAVRTSEKVFQKDIERKQFIKGFMQGGKRFAESIFRNLDISNGKAKYMKNFYIDGTKRALIRFNLGDSGYDYWELILEKNTEGKYRLVDWFQVSSGQLISISLGAIGKMLTDPNPGLLESLFGIKEIDQNMMEKMKSIRASMQERDFIKALNIVDSLPDKIKNSRIMCTVAINLANFSRDDALYRKMLSRLDRYHSSDPSAAFALIDHYIYQNDFNSALKAVGFLEKRVGTDALIMQLNSNINLLKGDNSKAIKFAKEAIKLENDFTDAYFTLSLAYVKLGQYRKAISIFDSLSDKFGYQFQKVNFLNDRDYADFVSSEDFKSWKIQ